MNAQPLTDLVDDDMVDDIITVRLAEPVEGVDPDDGEVFTASRHRVLGSSMRQDRHETLFLNAAGEVVARWDTGVIEQIGWSPTSSLSIAGRSSRAASAERIRLLRQRHPQAYHRWEPSEDEQLGDELRSGLSVAEMVERHGRARGGIMARLIHLQLIERGTPVAEIGSAPAPQPEVTPLPVTDALAS